MKIRIESSSSTRSAKTGVGYYSSRLIDSLDKHSDISINRMQFNFLGRQVDYSQRSSVSTINFPQKVYAKLDYFGLAFPFDLFAKKTDVTIFPNYALWPTVKSKFRVVTIHDLTFLKYPEVVEENNLKYLQRIVPRAVKNADLILTVSETVKKEIMDTYDVSPDKIYVTPVPPTEEYSQTSSRPVHKTYKIPTDKYILFASTVEPRKNLSTLLDAYAKLPERIKRDYSLVIAGGMGWKSDETRNKLVKIQSTEKNIITTGYYDQKDAAALYQKASLFVMPSLYEGFGMPLLEAMASRTPTLASDIPVFREVCGDASLFFPATDPETLSETIIKVLADEKSQSALVAKGLLNLERYSWRAVSQGLVTKLESLI